MKNRRNRDIMKWSHNKVFQMKITTFVVIFCRLVRSGVCLYCFSCSVMDTSKVGVFVNFINLGPDYHNLILFCYNKKFLCYKFNICLTGVPVALFRTGGVVQELWQDV